ncbi:MAG TPA: substrate-binding domain-containing protein [Candidatus Hydrogenedentes bacterium]|nr:substrate-binding domain-containing protein [Candidatus Hydrogenedentota bacterium]
MTRKDALIAAKIIVGGLMITLAAGLSGMDAASAEPVIAALLTDGTAWMTDFGNALGKVLAERDITLRVVAPATPLPESQAEKLAELNKGDAAVLLVWPASPIEPGASFKGVSLDKPLLLLGPDAPESGRKVAISPDPEALGHLFADLIRQCVPDGLLIGVLNRRNDDPCLKTLRKALEDELKAGEITPRQIMEDNGDPGAARENARELLEKHPELAGYVAVEPYHLNALTSAATETKRAGYVGIVGTGWPKTVGEALEKGFVNGVVYPDVQALTDTLAPMIRAAATADNAFAWPESGRVAMPLSTRFTPKPYGITEMLHGLPGDWNIKAPADKPQPPARKFD